MSEFDSKAREWDKDMMHMKRSVAIATDLEKMIPLNPSMKALEYGAGTGILSFLLKDKLAEIILMDSSQEMIKVCEEKAAYHHANHIKPIWYDLEHNDYTGKFDLIYNQMVLHHVKDTVTVLRKFYDLLNPAGYLAIADLYAEDGSFHGPDADVHKGFDPDKLRSMLTHQKFKNIQINPCFEVKRDSGKQYAMFLLLAQK